MVNDILHIGAIAKQHGDLLVRGIPLPQWLPALGVGEDLVGLVDLLELLRGIGRLVAVAVIFKRLLAKRNAEVFFRGAARNFQDVVIVALVAMDLGLGSRSAP
jgi:hypothetical protein